MTPSTPFHPSWRLRLRTLRPGTSKVLTRYDAVADRYIGRPLLTPEEQAEVKAGARWLRRIANPFIDLHVIVTVGTAVSSTTTNVSQRPTDPDVQDYLKDLYVCTVPIGFHRLTTNLLQHAAPA